MMVKTGSGKTTITYYLLGKKLCWYEKELDSKSDMNTLGTIKN